MIWSTSRNAYSPEGLVDAHLVDPSGQYVGTDPSKAAALLASNAVYDSLANRRISGSRVPNRKLPGLGSATQQVSIPAPLNVPKCSLGGEMVDRFG